MQVVWQHHRQSGQLIVFCNGWGMDEYPFLPVAAEHYDVLHLYDFREMTLAPLQEVLAQYSCLILIGWSMGVWAGQQLFGSMEHRFARTIAVNGTLCPIDDHYGIAPDLFRATMRGWSAASRRRFYRRLAGSRSVEELFTANKPHRILAEQQAELDYYLNHCVCCSRSSGMYREVCISSRDRIMPTASQLAFWGLDAPTMSGGHFPFYDWSSWDEFLTAQEIGFCPP